MARPPKRFKHQNTTLRRYAKSPILFDMSEPGTAKTRPAIEQWLRHGEGRLLVVCVLSNVEAVWTHELSLWAPDVEAGLALAPLRAPAFASGAPVVVVNTDGVKWIAENSPGRLLRDFDSLVVDESAYYKHGDSRRSQALAGLAPRFERRALLSGTPHPNGVTDLWHQMLILDGGERLGTNFHRFRYNVAIKEQVGHRPEAVRWIDKEGASEAVWSEIRDVSIRHELDKCTDLPEQVMRTVPFKLPPKLLAQAEELRQRALLLLKDGEVVGVHAAALAAKLLQLLSGAVYATDGRARVLDTSRYELVADLIEARPHSVVFFNWRHQREQLVKELTRRKVPHAYMDGTVAQSKRTKAVQQFQDGELRALLMHPKTGAHGFTLTRGTYSIWCSPIPEPDIFRQGNRRIRRPGQDQKTECLMVQANFISELKAYANLQRKDARMMELLDLVAEDE